ncbi:MAG: 30S ribosomal protein S9 [bacterium]|nr:30S ribosomal protein S9 [bacterium]
MTPTPAAPKNPARSATHSAVRPHDLRSVADAAGGKIAVPAKPTVRHVARPAAPPAHHAVRSDTDGRPRIAGHAVKAVSQKSTGRYFEAVGRRKTAVVRVRLHEGSESVKTGITVNDRPFAAYFPIERHQHIASAPLMGASLSLAEVRVTAHAAGGGVQAQAEALSLGIARALVKKEKTWRPRLKALGLLTRDSRKVEQKKFGSRKARRPQQWRKR